MKNLEILVVEDSGENRKAAEEFFSTTDVKADFAPNYEEAIQKLQRGIYAIGIFDLELPRTENAKPEKLGFDLARQAARYGMPWLIITSGLYAHGHSQSSFVLYCWSGLKKAKELLKMPPLDAMGELDMLQQFDFELLRGKPKTDPAAWQEAYEEVISKLPNIHEGFMARKRHMQFVGKPYEQDPQIVRSLLEEGD